MREFNPLVKNELMGCTGGKKAREREMEMKRQRVAYQEERPLSAADEVCTGAGK